MSKGAAAAAFLLGLASAGAVLAAALFPARLHEAWCRARLGGTPSGGGVVLSLRSAPATLAGSGRGPWVLCELSNPTQAPLEVVLPERAGDELAFRVEGPNGPSPPARDPGEPVEASALHVVSLPAGSRLAFPCDLSRWVRFEGPGTYRVRAERIDMTRRGGVGATSEALVLTVDGE